MSNALLKKSITILDDDMQAKSKANKSKNHMIDSNSRKVKRKSKNPQKINQMDVQQNTDENVKKLLMLSNFKLNDKMVKSTILRSTARHYKLPEKEPEKETESVFTEADFAKFAAEYHE